MVYDIVGALVGAGSIVAMHLYSDHQFPPNSKIHNRLRYPNPPILENIDLPIKQLLYELG